MKKPQVLFVLGVLGLLGCDEDVRESFRCQVSCEWAEECIDEGLDVQDCHDDCTDVIDDDSALSMRARDCERCVADEKCSTTDECEDDCFEVLDEAMPGWRD